MDPCIPDISSPRVQRWNYTHTMFVIIVLGTIISFIPLIISSLDSHVYAPYSGINNGGDDYLSSNTPIVYSPFCRESMIAALAIGIPFFIDLLFDLVATRSFKAYLDGGKTNAVRMNLVERSMFIVGVLMCGFTSIASTNTQFNIINALFTVSTNSTTFLCIAPLFIFLERISTNHRAPFQTLVAVICVTVVGILGSWQTIQLPSNSPDDQTITLVCLILILIVSAIFFNIVANKAIKHVRTIWTEAADKQVVIDDTIIMVVRTPYERMKDGWKRLKRLFETHYAVICVSIALFVVIISNIWFYIDVYRGAFSNYRFGFYMYANMMANSLVLVVEMRIRTNEVKSGLDVIESRRAFVRFVSHEVRTPLSTAIMGLQLLSEETNEEQASAAAVAAIANVVATNAAVGLTNRRQEQKDMLRYFNQSPT